MAEASGYICPECERSRGIEVELGRETYIFKCPSGHQYTYEELRSQGAKMIKLKTIERPVDGSMRYDLFLTPSLYDRFMAKFGDRRHATLGALVSALCDDSVLIIDGEIANKLRKDYKITNGEAMLATAENEIAQQATIEQMKGSLDMLRNIIKGAAGDMEPENLLA